MILDERCMRDRSAMSGSIRVRKYEEHNVQRSERVGSDGRAGSMTAKKMDAINN